MPRCAARGCSAQVPLGKPFCRPCFNRLPAPMREHIWQSSREIRREAFDGDIYCDNVMVAIRWAWDHPKT